MSEAAEDVSVVICAYTLDRWELTVEAVESAQKQTLPPRQIVLVIDNNAELLAKAQQHWSAPESPPVSVVANASTEHLAGRATHATTHGELRRFGAGTARNTGLSHIGSGIVAWIDDDAAAAPDWLERLVATYRPGVVAVGGAPLPKFAVPRPKWFPLTFDWIFGCAYFGMPTVAGPYTRLIGANMSTRVAELKSIDGFTGSDFDDLDVCTRLEDKFGKGSIYYEPAATVSHFVSANRVKPRYFLRRSYMVNREKVRVHRRMGSRDPLGPEVQFARNLLRYASFELRSLLRGDVSALSRLAMTVVGVSLAAAGNITGQWRYRTLQSRQAGE